MQVIALNFVTVDSWDEVLWQQAGKVYEDAFADKGGKRENIIRNMLAREIAQLHVLFEESYVIAMGLTGHVSNGSPLIIDYLAVSKEYQKQGYGKALVDYIIEWSVKEKNIERIYIEVECEETVENQERIEFWKKCGFQLTDYVHQYIWVPEPYKGMYLLLNGASEKIEGEDIFKEIVALHRLSFRK